MIIKKNASWCMLVVKKTAKETGFGGGCCWEIKNIAWWKLIGGKKTKQMT